VGFAIGNFGYAGLGTDGSGNMSKQFYKYDAGNNSWSAIAPFPGKARCVASAFVINGIAYVGGGLSILNNAEYYAVGDYYAYDPNTNTWTPVPGLPGYPRQGAVTFTINNSGYSVGGYDNDGDVYYDIVNEFGSCSVISEIPFMGGNGQRLVSVFPNPTTGELNVKVAGDELSELTFEVTNLAGQLVKSGDSRLNTFSFSTNALGSGMYLLTIKDKAGSITVKRFEVIK